MSVVFTFLHLIVVLINYSLVELDMRLLSETINFLVKKYYSGVALVQRGDVVLYLGGVGIVPHISTTAWYPWTYVVIGSITTVFQISFIIYKKIQSKTTGYSLSSQIGFPVT